MVGSDRHMVSNNGIMIGVRVGVRSNGRVKCQQVTSGLQGTQLPHTQPLHPPLYVHADSAASGVTNGPCPRLFACRTEDVKVVETESGRSEAEARLHRDGYLTKHLVGRQLCQGHTIEVVGVGESTWGLADTTQALEEDSGLA